MNFTQPVKRDDPNTGTGLPGAPATNATQFDVTVDPSADPVSVQTDDITINESEARLYGSAADKPEDTQQVKDQGDKYKRLREIARGGMGVILEAVDNSLHREVAMKVMINPREASPQRVARFIEEACITSQLQHPGIIPIYEMGTEKNGNVFYTMKRVTGRTLKDILKDLKGHKQEVEAEYTLNHLLNILQRVCDAVAYAHSMGVIHRDLKPENIMLGDYGEVLILDWGLAKVLDRQAQRHRGQKLEVGLPCVTLATPGGQESEVGESSEFDINETMEGNAIGTPGYMAPEQARGQVSRMDEKSDIYSLGAILYHILALEPAILCDKATRRKELLEQISSGQIEPIKETSRAPNSLIAVAMKALSLQPNDRYQTVKAFQADLDAYLGGFATSAEELSVWKLITLFVLRHKVVSIAIAVILVLEAAALSVNIREKLKAQHAEQTALAAERSMQVEKNNAQQALLNLKATAPALVLLCESHLQHNELEEALKIISNVTELSPENHEYHNRRGNILQTMYRFKEASEEYKTVLKLAPGDRNATENLEICRDLEVEPQKLFLALRRQNRNDEAAHIVKSLANRPQTLKTFVKSILESEKMVYRNIQFDNQGMGIVELESVSDLSPWKLLPITSLSLQNCRQVSDLSPLKGMPLTSLEIPGADGISDLSPLAGMSLTNLYLEGGKFSDLAPLKDMPLTSLSIRWNSLSDISPLKGLPLEYLSLMGCANIPDLTPLNGMPLTKLDLWGCKFISDLTPLIGMPINKLHLEATGVSDLSPLKNMPLTYLTIAACNGISDLSPLKGMPELVALDLKQSKNISDLSPLSSLPLEWLHIEGCSKISNLTPIKNLQLELLSIDEPLLAREKEIVLGLKFLKTINDMPAPEFWKRFNRQTPTVTR